MKLKRIASLALVLGFFFLPAVFLPATASTDDSTKLVVDPEPAFLPGLVTADIEPFGVYSISDAGEWGVGLDVGFTLEGLLGLEGEYLWLSDSQRHLTFLNGYLQMPLSDTLEVRPFVGGGAWGEHSVSAAAQGGLEVIQDFDFITAVAGARYIWLDGDTGLTAFTLGIRWEF